MSAFTRGKAAAASAMLKSGASPSRVSADLGVRRDLVYRMTSGRIYSDITGGPIDWKFHRKVAEGRPEDVHDTYKPIEDCRASWDHNLAVSIKRLRKHGGDVKAQKRLLKSIDGAMFPRDAADRMWMPVDAWLHFRRHGRMSAVDVDRALVLGAEMAACGGDVVAYEVADAAAVALAQSSWA